MLTGAEVTAVESHGSGPLGSAGDDVTISVAIDPASATRLATALEAGTVTLVRATGAAPVANAAPFMPAGKG